MSESTVKRAGIKWYHVHVMHSLLALLLCLLYVSPLYNDDLYKPWVYIVRPLVVIIICFDWLRVKWSMEKGASCRKYPYYLILALLFRRLPGRKCRPRFGTYWSHKLVRHRWVLIFIKSYYLPLCVGSLYYRPWQIYLASALPVSAVLLLMHLEYITMFISAVIATAGYSLESPRWGHPFKAVETNFFGILFCLMCYPPVRDLLPAKVITGDFFDQYRIFAVGSIWHNGIQALMVVFMVFHVYAIMVQGLRFANLTYRGTVSKGPYAVIRHPQYITKIVWFFFAWLPFFGSFRNVICYLGWTAIYVGRTITEERFLKQFPDYRAYCEKVKWRYIPGIW